MLISGIMQSFGSGHVYVTPKNNGEDIRRIVEEFNDSFVPSKDNISDKVNFMLPAAGAGTKLRPLTSLVGDYNKVSFPFPVTDKESMYMIEFPMTLGKLLVDKSGYNVVSTPSPSGNFAPVVEHYLKHPEDKRPVMYMGADTIIDLPAEDFADIVNSDIQNNVHVDLLGMYKTPEETADTFGLFIVDENDKSDKKLGRGLKLFLEKKPLEETKKYAIYNGKNITNTGVTFFSRDAIEKVMERIKYEQTHPDEPKMFAKNETEIYNTANVMDYLFANFKTFFGQSVPEGVKVRIIPSWDDIGLCEAYIDFLRKIQTGKLLSNFSKGKADRILASVKNRLGNIDGKNYLVLSRQIPSIDSLSREDIKKAKDVCGCNVVV